jgi:predicted  nucleic acid-binding Zn-ribbon protein
MSKFIAPYSFSIDKIKVEVEKNQAELEEVHNNYEQLQEQYNKVRSKLEEREVLLVAKENEIKVITFSSN